MENKTASNSKTYLEVWARRYAAKPMPVSQSQTLVGWLFFIWVSLAETERLFLQLTQEKFGDLDWNINLKSYE